MTDRDHEQDVMRRAGCDVRKVLDRLRMAFCSLHLWDTGDEARQQIRFAVSHLRKALEDLDDEDFDQRWMLGLIKRSSPIRDPSGADH